MLLMKLISQDRETRVIVANILDALRLLQKAEALSLMVMHLVATFIQGALRSEVKVRAGPKLADRQSIIIISK